MPLTLEQVKELKAQLSSQIRHLPEAQKAEAQKQIDALSPQALESMLKQQQTKAKSDKGVFRMIIDGEIPSKKIDENKDALAVLDIKPISKGHTIIIPKKPVKNPKDMPTNAFNLAKKLAKKLESKLKAKSSEIQTESKFGEVIINIIPIYDQPLDIHSQRQDAQEKDLEEVYQKIRAVKLPKIEKIKKVKSPTDVVKMNRRIP